MTLLTSWLPLLNIILLLAVSGAGAFVFTRARSRTIGEIQERVIAALKDENGALDGALATLRAKLEQQDIIISTIRVMLQREGMEVIVNGEVVTLINRGKPKQVTMKLRKDTVRHLATRNDTPHDEGHDDGA